MHVTEILDRESGLAIVLLRARRQHAETECPRPSDQLGLGIAQAERLWGKERGVAVVQVERRGHRLASRVTAMPCGTAKAARMFTIDEIIVLRAVATGRLAR